VWPIPVRAALRIGAAELVARLQATGAGSGRTASASISLSQPAYVPGLPVYAAADTQAKAERAIRAVLTAYLETHPDSRPEARVRVARFSTTARTPVDIVGPAALVGAHRSAMKARASRQNGSGGRPRKAEPAQRRRASRRR
jgi:hypothetical protein